MSLLRSFAFRWCIALILHESLLSTPVLANAVSTLFSPGPHTPWTSLGIAAAFLILRVFVVLLWPAAVVSVVRVFWKARILTAQPRVDHALGGLPLPTQGSSGR